MSVEKNLAILREQLTQAEAKSRDLLAQYIANRQRSYEALARIDPDSQFTRDAKERLEKARRDLEEFEANLATTHAQRAEFRDSTTDKETPAAGEGRE